MKSLLCFHAKSLTWKRHYKLQELFELRFFEQIDGFLEQFVSVFNSVFWPRLKVNRSWLALEILSTCLPYPSRQQKLWCLLCLIILFQQLHWAYWTLAGDQEQEVQWHPERRLIHQGWRRLPGGVPECEDGRPVPHRNHRTRRLRKGRLGQYFY